MTLQMQKQLQFQNVRMHLTVGHFSDSCTVSYREGEYILSDFSLSPLEDLTVRIGEGKVQHTLADLSLSPVTDGVEGFLEFYRLLEFLQNQEYHCRDAEQTEGFRFTFPFEGKGAVLNVTKSGRLQSVFCGSLSIEIQEGNG